MEKELQMEIKIYEQAKNKIYPCEQPAAVKEVVTYFSLSQICYRKHLRRDWLVKARQRKV